MRILYFFCLLSGLLLNTQTLLSQADYNWPLDHLMIKFDGNGITGISPSLATQSSAEACYTYDYNNNKYVYTVNANRNIVNESNNYICDIYSLNFNNTLWGISLLPFEEINKLVLITMSGGIEGTWTPYYHEVDLNENEVPVKNMLFLPYPRDYKNGYLSIRHGNGRDWWVIFHILVGNEYYIAHIDTGGIVSFHTQTLGQPHGLNSIPISEGGIGGIIANKPGDKLICYSGEGAIDELSFDRCTGTLGLIRNISPAAPGSSMVLYSAALSPNGQVLYLNNADMTIGNKAIKQYNLNSSNPLSTEYTLMTQGSSGNIRLGPDNRIYFLYNQGTNGPASYKYLQIIHNPDVMGSGCNHQLNAYFLQNQITGILLPNFPNYNLGPLAGSGCDTLAIHADPYAQEEAGIRLYPNPVIGNALNIILPQWEGQGKIILSDLSGRVLHSEPIEELPQTLRMHIAVPRGFYLICFESEKGKQYWAKLGIEAPLESIHIESR